ncbi:hypothetical protein [Sphingobium sp. DC-2]|uniref:hypothetical protein n=1 Tax=Sphingobium sp. DC-2 TaxID=1303256 RepID=UPI000B025AB0|nr:hypothetical protein [Sphingobium sp. DC-2]
MSRIPHTARIAGRYAFRRRIYFRNISSKILSIALQTADPKVARRRAAFLSARFAIVKLSVDLMLKTNGVLTGDQIEAIFRQELEDELTQALHDAYENASWSSSIAECAVPLAEAYRIARRPDRPRQLTDEDRKELSARGLGRDLSQIDGYLRELCHEIADREVCLRLEAVGIEPTADLISTARAHILRARADAWKRATRMFDDDVMDAANPLQALTADLGTPTARVEALRYSARCPPVLQAGTPPLPPNVAHAVPSECHFMTYDDRRFGDVIDEVIAELKADGVWKGPTHQQRRIMETFAWITGNRPLGSYNHLDAPRFKQGIQKMPVTFRFGGLSEGAMSRPFEKVLSELPPLSPSDRRSNKTVNRDLSFMATVAKHLGKTAWKPKAAGAVIMDFGSVRVRIKTEDSTELRPPWTRAHMEILFASPLYLGGGGALHRLKTDGPLERVWHDSAFYAPLIWYYTSACREEICGLEVADIIANHRTPHIKIRDNLTRGRDGEKAGEKRIARRRDLPIHPELIRLGFLAYVEAIKKEGHVALFPELYPDGAEKRGGAFFYERAWRHMVDYIGERLPLPTNDRGKGPDIHSIRALGASFYEVDGVNDNIRADIMGHARQGTNGKHYSKRIQTEGADVVLAERLTFMLKYIPIVSEHISAAPIRLVPLEKRARVGSPFERKTRNDTGRARRRA